MRRKTLHWAEARAKGRPGNSTSALASLEAVCNTRTTEVHYLQLTGNGFAPSPEEK